MHWQSAAASSPNTSISMGWSKSWISISVNNLVVHGGLVFKRTREPWWKTLYFWLAVQPTTTTSRLWLWRRRAFKITNIRCDEPCVSSYYVVMTWWGSTWVCVWDACYTWGRMDQVWTTPIIVHMHVCVEDEAVWVLNTKTTKQRNTETTKSRNDRGR